MFLTKIVGIGKRHIQITHIPFANAINAVGNMFLRTVFVFNFFKLYSVLKNNLKGLNMEN